MQQQPATPVLGDRNFRRLLAGSAVACLGDHLTLFTLPWLILAMTGDACALGVALALMCVPRAVATLVGGAPLLRYPPRRAAVLARGIAAALLGALAGLTLCRPALLSIPLLQLFALALGLAQAVAAPAGLAMVPAALAPAQLPAASGMLTHARQAVMLAAPLLAALLIGIADHGGTGAMWPAASGPAAQAGGTRGIGLVFALGCAASLLAAWTLNGVTAHHARRVPAGAAPPAMRALADGWRAIWDDVALRTCFCYWALVAVTVGGTLQVALPLLASGALGGAPALAVLTAAHGAGALLGMALARTGSGLRIGTLGATLLTLDAVGALLLLPLAAITGIGQGAALLLVMGVLTGFAHLAAIGWLRTTVRPHMLGLAMRFAACIFAGLTPLSAAALGGLLRYITLTQLFAVAAAILLAIAALAWQFTPMPRIAHAKGS